MVKRWHSLLIVLILNLLLFAWGYQRPLPQLPAPPPLPPGKPTIQLLSEVVPLSPAVPSPLHEGGKSCVRLGPLDQQKMAFDLSSTLETAGHQTKLEPKLTHQQNGFWVLIAADEEHIEGLMADLQAAGILDVWRFRNGPLVGTVSLGLYSDRNQAEERLATLTDKGFSAEIRPRETEASTYWIRTYYAENNQDAKKALEHAYTNYPTLNFPPQPCQSAGAPIY